jgi:hypothetical protein
MFTLTITLRSGEAQSFTVAKMPAHWKSWLMRQLPYGTDFQGASFSRGYTVPVCAACERPQDASAAEPCTCIELAESEDAAEEILAAERFAAEAAATQAQAFSAALDAFKRAAGDLAAAWQAPAIGGDAVADYPGWMPSFDEAALDIAGMEVQR